MVVVTQVQIRAVRDRLGASPALNELASIDHLCEPLALRLVSSAVAAVLATATLSVTVTAVLVAESSVRLAVDEGGAT